MNYKRDTYTAREINRIYPIVAARFYRNGTVETIRSSPPAKKAKIPKRSTIKEFSRKSRLRMALVVCETGVEFESFITLTYGINYPMSGIEVKANLRKMLDRLAWWQGKFDYLWFFEFQRRGAPHIHIICDLPPLSLTSDRGFFSSLWVDEVLDRRDIEYSTLKDRKTKRERETMYQFHKRPEQWEAIRERDGAKRYALKYATKIHQKTVPSEYQNVGRFWGHSKRVGRLEYRRVPMTAGDIRRIVSRARPDIENYEIIPRVIFGALK